jgi:TatD DNase family protein
VDLPVVVHTRAADEETAAILEEEGAREVGGVIHCFTGGEDLARRVLLLGFCISFSGIVAFPRRTEVIRKVAREMPADRLLVETDAPFLAPPPHRGKRNEPAFVVEVVHKVAELRGEEPVAIAALARRNYARLFGRDDLANV